jgi:exodeoxyribonuclease VII small subunit
MEFKDFEQALKRLEEIVAELEKGELALERAVELFEEGIKVSRLCGEKLEEAERKVELLIKDSQGALKARPLENVGVETEGDQESDE